MAKEPTKYTSKSKRKPEYSPEGIAMQEDFQQSNEGRVGEPLNNVIMGGRKRGHGRGKASDAGPSRKRAA